MSPDFNVDSPLFCVGFTARQLWAPLCANFLLGPHKAELESDEQDQQVIINYVEVLAARTCISEGEWSEVDDVKAIKLAFRGALSSPQ